MTVLKRSGVFPGHGIVPGFEPIPGGVVGFSARGISRLGADLDTAWVVEGGLGGLWIEPTSLLHIDRPRGGEWLLRRRSLLDGAHLLTVPRELGENLAAIDGCLLRKELAPTAQLICLAIDDLAQRWAIPWPGSVASRDVAVVPGGLVHDGVKDATSAVCTNVSDGSERWRFDLPRIGVAGERERLGLGVAILVAERAVILLTTGGRIYVLDAKSGSLLGQSRRPAGQPIVWGGKLFFVSATGIRRAEIPSLDMDDLVDLRSAATEVSAAGWPQVHGVALAGDTAAFRTSGGDLVVLTQEGQRWRASSAEIGGPAPFSEAPVIANGRIYCLDRARYELLAFPYR